MGIVFDERICRFYVGDYTGHSESYGGYIVYRTFLLYDLWSILNIKKATGPTKDKVAFFSNQ